MDARCLRRCQALRAAAAAELFARRHVDGLMAAVIALMPCWVGCAGAGGTAESPSNFASDAEALLQRVRAGESWLPRDCVDVQVRAIGEHDGCEDARVTCGSHNGRLDAPLACQSEARSSTCAHTVRDYLVVGCDLTDESTCDDLNGCITDNMRHEHIVSGPSLAPPAAGR